MELCVEGDTFFLDPLIPPEHLFARRWYGQGHGQGHISSFSRCLLSSSMRWEGMKGCPIAEVLTF